MTQDNISLAVLGTSEGNGHPYSWSAIINGYNSDKLISCPYPVIRNYLSDVVRDTNDFKNVQITHIWTQDEKESENIANFANIKNISKDYKNIINEVDGILLARDDFENHQELSYRFLEAGLPVYIDKPIAVKKIELSKIFNHQRYNGQIFSCSALKNANEFKLSDDDLTAYGRISAIKASAPNDWLHYAIHIIDPVIKLFKLNGEYKLINKSTEIDGSHTANFKWNNDITIEFETTGSNTPLFIEIIGDKKKNKIEFKDTYSAFKNTLELFIDNIRYKNNPTTREELEIAVGIIEKGYYG